MTTKSSLPTSGEIIIFSPHLDDAILSMGSFLFESAARGSNIRIFNVFTEGSDLVSSLTVKLLTQAGFKDVAAYFEARRKEDREVIDMLGQSITIQNLGFLDAPWRKDGQKPFYPSTTWHTRNEADTVVVEELIHTLKALALPADTRIFAPLGRGRHIDHVIVRDVCAQIFPDVIYYTDLPYSAKNANEDQFIQEHNLQPIEWDGSYTRKNEVILKYETQMNALFPTRQIDLPKEVYYI